MALHLTKLESLLPKDALYQVCLKLWSKRILDFVNTFSQFCNYLPFKKGGVFHLNNLESPLFQVWLKLAKCSGEEDENVKSLKTDGGTDGQTDGQADDGQHAIRKAHLKFQIR